MFLGYGRKWGGEGEERPWGGNILAGRASKLGRNLAARLDRAKGGKAEKRGKGNSELSQRGYGRPSELYHQRLIEGGVSGRKERKEKRLLSCGRGRGRYLLTRGIVLRQENLRD